MRVIISIMKEIFKVLRLNYLMHYLIPLKYVVGFCFGINSGLQRFSWGKGQKM